jgi:hypothetical protein
METTCTGCGGSEFLSISVCDQGDLRVVVLECRTCGKGIICIEPVADDEEVENAN